MRQLVLKGGWPHRVPRGRACGGAWPGHHPARRGVRPPAGGRTLFALALFSFRPCLFSAQTEPPRHTKEGLVSPPGTPPPFPPPPFSQNPFLLGRGGGGELTGPPPTPPPFPPGFEGVLGSLVLGLRATTAQKGVTGARPGPPRGAPPAGAGSRPNGTVASRTTDAAGKRIAERCAMRASAMPIEPTPTSNEF